MASDLTGFANSATGFTKSPLGIIALFIVLVYGFATLAVTFGDNLAEHVGVLIYFLVLFPVVVFVGFLWLVTRHPDKIYGPSDFKNEENFLKMKMKMSTAASLAVASAKQPNGTMLSELDHDQLNDIVELVSKTQPNPRNGRPGKGRNRILWVDNRPENNVYERKAFEAQGIEFTLARSTDEAMKILQNQKFAAIISDMDRPEGPEEGYVLLDKIRQNGDNTPFFIYAGSGAVEHKQQALERGAQGSTNRAQELYEMVMNRIAF